MKQLRRLLTFTGLFVAALFLVINLDSCSSHKGIVSCPDVHHGSLAMHHVHYHNGNALAHNHHKDAGAQQATNTSQPTKTVAAPQPTKANAVDPNSDAIYGGGGGLASSSRDLPKFKNPKELFKLMTEDEREEAKSTVSKVLAKHPFIRKMAIKKMERMDKKYPAPAKSTLNNGGGLGTGEILAIVAIVCSVFFFLGIVGLILGIIALGMIKKNGGANWARILAIVAIILGALDILILILWLVIVVAILGGAFL